MYQRERSGISRTQDAFPEGARDQCSLPIQWTGSLATRSPIALALVMCAGLASGCATPGEPLNLADGRSFEVLELKHETNPNSEFHAAGRLRVRYVTIMKDSAALAAEAKAIAGAVTHFALRPGDSLIVVEAARPLVARSVPLYRYGHSAFRLDSDSKWAYYGTVP